MQSFSQRKGLKPVSEIIQTDSMNMELRNGLWNCLDNLIWSTKGFMYNSQGKSGMYYFSRSLWEHYFKMPIDTVSRDTSGVLTVIRQHYFACEWNEVYDFIEFVADYMSMKSYSELFKSKVYDTLNSTLERELSAYRFVNGQLTDITSEQEIEMLQEVLEDTQFKGVSNHLQRALELYSDRANPDYRNSIKESISAVESMAKVVTENPKAMLSDALKILEKNGQLHKALKDGFEKLYAYTSDAEGIRHAMLEQHSLTAADARYFLLSCTSFVNYLKSKI
jgi:hypothetical protein